MRKVLLFFAAAASLGAGGVARAQFARGAQEHDGFFLQLDIGPGWMKSSTSDTIIGDVDLSGGGVQFSVAIGGAVAPNFILAGQLWGATVDSPEVKVDGQKLGSSGSELTLTGIGLNLTYYFMPINFYISATPSIGMLSEKQAGETAETKNGFALRLAAGKEWWVSDNWGLGLNVQFAYSSNEDKGTNPPTWGTTWFGVAFSATYN